MVDVGIAVLQEALLEEIPYMLFYRKGKFCIVSEDATWVGETLKEAIQDLYANPGGEDDDDDPDGDDGTRSGIEDAPSKLRLVAGGKA